MIPDLAHSYDVRARLIRFDVPRSARGRSDRGPAAPSTSPTERPGRSGRVVAVAIDLDRTILRPGGRPTARARRAVREIRAMGLWALLVSGRKYDDLLRLAKGLGPWDGLVAEDGAVVEAPAGRPPRITGRRVAASVRARFAAGPRLHPEFGVVVASVPRAERLDLLRAITGLPVTVVANVDRLMVLPAGVTKGSGVGAALGRLGAPGGAYAAIGDAENDLGLLRGAALSAAVANALPLVRSTVDYVCRDPFDRGVLEFVEGPLRARLAATRRAT